jgi:putative ABC transport system ATP-binding protein
MKEETGHITQLVNVTKHYEGPGQGTVALKNVSFAAGPGEMILLLGPSGSGKTTLLTLLAGLQSPTTGEVYLFGKKTNEYSPKELQSLRAKRLGFIFQTFYLLDSLTVLQNVMMIMHFAGVSREKARSTSMEYLRKFGVEKLSGKFPPGLSQGEKQRVAIARAMVNGAGLIIGDEPTGSLASKQGMEIVEFLKESSRDENRCVIIASHDERIIQYAGRVLTLSDGELKN